MDKDTALKKSKRFCMLPWTHLHSWPDGRVLPCCMAPMDEILGNLKDQSFEEIRTILLSAKYGHERHPEILECFPNGPKRTIGLVEEGDSITVDANKLLIQLNVEERELARRKEKWEKPKPRYKTGILGKYSRLVSSSSQGATTDQI